MIFTILIDEGVSVWFLCRLVRNIFGTAWEMWGHDDPMNFSKQVKVFIEEDNWDINGQ